MPSVSFKKDELRFLLAVLTNYRLGVQDEISEYAIADGEANFYDEQERERLKSKVEYIEHIAYKLSKQIYPV